MENRGSEVQSGSSAPFRDEPPFRAAVGEHRFEFFADGGDRRDAVLAMIREARHSLKLVFYIFAQDTIGTLVRDELTAAAARGVSVILMIDSFGSSATDRFLAPLAEAGGRFHRSNPRLSQRYLIRNHQKMIIADDTRAIFGGFNIEDDYFAPPCENGWNDLAVRLEGPAVAGLVEWFGMLDAWTLSRHPRFKDVRRAVREWDWPCGELRWLVGGPTKGVSTWARCVRQDLKDASRVDMMMAYFSPPPRYMARIGAIAKRGGARLVMAGKSDNGATIGAARSLYGGMLKRGVRIWEFTPCKLHSKLIVIDDTVYIGSANFDMRSLYINLEVMLQIKDAALADRMRDHISQHIAASREITPALHRARSTPLNRLRWWLGWALVAVVDYTVTRRLNLGLGG